MRAMANAPGGDALLAELKAVDAAYPLYGTMRLVSGARRGPPPPGGVWIGADLASRLALTTGSRVTFGEKTFRLYGVIHDEPARSEARRVGKDWLRKGRSRWSPYH